MTFFLKKMGAHLTLNLIYHIFDELLHNNNTKIRTRVPLRHRFKKNKDVRSAKVGHLCFFI